jgi:hypothetical protein
MENTNNDLIVDADTSVWSCFDSDFSPINSQSLEDNLPPHFTLTDQKLEELEAKFLQLDQDLEYDKNILKFKVVDIIPQFSIYADSNIDTNRLYDALNRKKEEPEFLDV